jgi:hypothetical protein
MGRCEPSSVPGCRAPHVWLGDGRSLYDALGDGYGLIRFDQSAAVDGLVMAARRRGVPLVVLDIDDEAARARYARKLTLVRPDRHVAWRADVEPDQPLALIDHLRGVRAVPAEPSRRTVAAAPAQN